MIQELDDQYQKKQVLGQGTYGVVYKAIHLRSNEVVALKKIKLQNDDQGMPSTAMREISILKQLRPHPNIVDLRQVYYRPVEKKLHLIFQYVDYDLKKYLNNNCKKISQDKIKVFMFQLVNGLNFCHSRRIIHRDLKPQNLLIDKNDNLKIADFGLARTFGIPLKTLTHQIETLWYRAPEILLGQRHYSLGVDIWAVGCIFAQLLMERPLFQGDCQIDQIFRIFKFHGTPTKKQWLNIDQLPNFKPTFPKFKKVDPQIYFQNLNQFALDLLMKMIVLNPSQRISMKDTLKHHYFKDIPQEMKQIYMAL